MKIALGTLKILKHQGMTRAQIRRAVALVEQKRKILLEMWHASRPDE